MFISAVEKQERWISATNVKLDRLYLSKDKSLTTSNILYVCGGQRSSINIGNVPDPFHLGGNMRPRRDKVSLNSLLNSDETLPVLSLSSTVYSNGTLVSNGEWIFMYMFRELTLYVLCSLVGRDGAQPSKSCFVWNIFLHHARPPPPQKKKSLSRWGCPSPYELACNPLFVLLVGWEDHHRMYDICSCDNCSNDKC